MTTKLIIETDDPLVIAAVSDVLNGSSRHLSRVVTATPIQATEARQVEGALGVATSEQAAATPPTNSGEFGEASALIAKLDKQYQRAATATSKTGTRLKEGDEVSDTDGQIGVVAALYRGRAVIRYDDGSGAEVGPSTLTPYSAPAAGDQDQGDAGTPAGTASVSGEVLSPGSEDGSDGDDDGDAAAAAALLSDDEPDQGGAVTHDDIRLCVEALMKVKGAKYVLALVEQNTGTQRISSIPEGQLVPFYAILQKELAG